MKEVERAFVYKHVFAPKEEEDSITVRSLCGGVEVLVSSVNALNSSKSLCPVCFKEK
jgi:hypothetical protein